jgi:hypothetical protein
MCSTQLRSNLLIPEYALTVTLEDLQRFDAILANELTLNPADYLSAVRLFGVFCGS